ncbi:SAM-dependent methyltransferase [Shewanella sp. AS16]|uniref:methyltransferase n=1 Tax=Shewanella sp. AS16 TaxID=2907625 RepID=UPI001F23AD8B|nr:methyltransferase [Shewanella sp. AS16]MCE9685026.1 SAM-dependent methyltransferase [Shewanella sp. AS16]
MSHLGQFRRLDSLLLASRSLWQLRAFDCHDLPWQGEFPRLAAEVLALNDDELEPLDRDHSLLVRRLTPALSLDLAAAGLEWPLGLLDSRLPAFANGVGSASEFKTSGVNASGPTASGASACGLSAADEPHFSAHIKGRKWQQIGAFVECLPHLGLPVLEWCAGKGHLGRLLAKARGCEVLSLEWQPGLCEQGREFARKWQLPQQFVCADAFAPQICLPGASPLQPRQQALALHACGDLHVRLLELAAAAGTQAVAISPCCYHLIHASHYVPMSAAAKASELRLSRHDLQLPLQQSVIAGAKQQALRLQEIAWRLGFDSLQRELRQVNEYLPVPAIKQSQLSGSFGEFCHWAATAKGLVLPYGLAFEEYRRQGLRRQRLTRRLDLVAHLFRAVVEHWLLLDRVCFLEGQGYRVSLGEFCANSVTPRNAMIQAFKIAG